MVSFQDSDPLSTKFLDFFFLKMVGTHTDMQNFTDSFHSNIETDLQLFGDQIDKINLGECDVETKWRLIESIEERVYNIFPNLDDMLLKEDAEDVGYRYYLLLSSLRRQGLVNSPHTCYVQPPC